MTPTNRKSFIQGKRERSPNDHKLSDRGVRRGTCMVGGKGAAEAGAVTHGAVRCSAWLGLGVIFACEPATETTISGLWVSFLFWAYVAEPAQRSACRDKHEALATRRRPRALESGAPKVTREAHLSM